MLSTTKRSLNKLSAGFTLLELLVVIVIIGLLATVISFSYSNSRARANDASRVSDLKILANALELYRSDNFNKYPGLKANWSATFAQHNTGKQAYLPEGAPTDPDSSRLNELNYVYCVSQAQDKYVLITRLIASNQNDSLIGQLASYGDGQCQTPTGDIADYDGLVNGAPCGQLGAEGLYVYCLGKL